MSTKTMTLYEALAQKKILEKRVNDMRVYRMVDTKKKYGDENKEGSPIESIKESIQSAYDSTIALVDNLKALTCAINDANAKTLVTINGEEMSIANAIALQRYIDKEEYLYKSMLSNYASVKSSVESHNTKVLNPDSVSSYVSKVLGDSKKDEALIEATKNSYIIANEIEVYDPMNTEKIATERLEKLALFKEEIHYKLTKVNCDTEITVEFND